MAIYASMPVMSLKLFFLPWRWLLTLSTATKTLFNHSAIGVNGLVLHLLGMMTAQLVIVKLSLSINTIHSYLGIRLVSGTPREEITMCLPQIVTILKSIFLLINFHTYQLHLITLRLTTEVQEALKPKNEWVMLKMNNKLC